MLVSSLSHVFISNSRTNVSSPSKSHYCHSVKVLVSLASFQFVRNYIHVLESR
jgi:hypothetical protein